MMRILFMGTPEFAVPSLEILAKEHLVLGVYTQTDKPSGRGKKLAFSPVKEKALSLDIPVYQPPKINEESTVSFIRALNPDLIVVVAYGQILKEDLLAIPQHGCINVHGSLLPKLRGAAPIQFAFLEGFSETGVTTMYMAKGLDSGDMIYKSHVKIQTSHTAGDIHDILMMKGAVLLSKTIKAIEKGQAPREVQDESQATFCSLIKKEMAQLDWKKSAVDISRMVKGFNPWPVAYTFMNQRQLKVYQVKCINQDIAVGCCGAVLRVLPDGIDVQTGEGIIRICSLQVPGSRRMDANVFLLGHHVEIGTVLGA